MLLDDRVVLGVLLAHTYSQDGETTAVLDTTLTLQALPRRGDHPRVCCSCAVCTQRALMQLTVPLGPVTLLSTFLSPSTWSETAFSGRSWLSLPQ